MLTEVTFEVMQLLIQPLIMYMPLLAVIGSSKSVKEMIFRGSCRYILQWMTALHCQVHNLFPQIIILWQPQILIIMLDKIN